MANQPLEQCIRRTLEILRDELRLRSAKYEGMRHEKLFSPLPVTATGWKAFITTHRSEDSPEHWHVESDGWLGRFTGDLEGLRSFEELARLFSMVTGRSLLDVVHDFAILDTTPLLQVIPSVWNWEPEDHIHEEGYVMDVEPFLEEWIESSAEEARYPKHPLIRQFNGNVFFCAATAIDLVLTPEIMFLRQLSEEDLPITIEDLTEQRSYSCPVSSSPTVKPEEPEIEFLFRQTGDTWQIRYTTATKTEHGVFSSMKGLERYAVVLQSPNSVVPSLDFDSGDRGSARSATDEGDSDDASSNENRYEHSLTWSEIRELRQGVEELIEQIDDESDPARKKRLKGELSVIKRKLHSGLDLSLVKSHAEKAQRKIKKSLYDARAKLRKGGMPLFADHLEAFVLSEGYGYAYRPDRQIHWTL